MRDFVNLGEFTRIRTGKLDANAASLNGKYPFFTCSQEPLHIDNYSYDCECVLVAGNGDLNVKYYNGKFDAYQRTYIIESIDKNILLPRYMFYFLELYIETLRKESIGGVIKYIKLGNLTNARIYLPDITTQQTIVEVLDKCTAVVSSRKRQLTKYDLLVKSQFIEMFGGIDESQFKSLSDVGKISTGSTPSMKIPEYYEKRELPFIKPSDIGLEVSHIYQGESAVDNRAKPVCRLFGRGTVLVTCIGTIGKIGISEIEATCNQQINFIEPYATINPSFLAYAIGSRKAQLVELANAPVVPIINKSLFSTFRIPVASVEEQNQFAAFVEQTDKSKDIYGLEVAA